MLIIFVLLVIFLFKMYAMIVQTLTQIAKNVILKLILIHENAYYVINLLHLKLLQHLK